MIDDYDTHEEVMEESTFYFTKATDEEKKAILERRRIIALNLFEDYGKNYINRLSPNMMAGFSFVIGKTMDVFAANPASVLQAHAEFGDVMKLAYAAGWRDHADQQNINHMKITGGTNETD